MKNSLVEQKARDRRFIEQLLDGSKLEAYDISVPIKAELRKYQQVRLNFLLKLYNHVMYQCNDCSICRMLLFCLKIDILWVS